MGKLILPRRKVLFGLLAAPLVVAAANIMPVKIPNWRLKRKWLVNWGNFNVPMVTNQEQAKRIAQMSVRPAYGYDKSLGIRERIPITAQYFDDETFKRDILPILNTGDLAVCLEPDDSRPRITPKPERVSIHAKMDDRLLSFFTGRCEVKFTPGNITVTIADKNHLIRGATSNYADAWNNPRAYPDDVDL